MASITHWHTERRDAVTVVEDPSPMEVTHPFQRVTDDEAYERMVGDWIGAARNPLLAERDWAGDAGDASSPTTPTPGRSAYSLHAMAGVTVRGVAYLVRTGQVVGSPRSVSLRLIDWYRAEVSAGRHCCPTGATGLRPSCSRLGRRLIERYGALLGWYLALARARQCSALSAPQGTGSDCEDIVFGCCDPCGKN